MNKKILLFIALSFFSSTLMMTLLTAILFSLTPSKTGYVTTLFGHLPLIVYALSILVAPVILALLSHIYKITLPKAATIYSIILLLALAVNFIKFYFTTRAATFNDLIIDVLVLGIVPLILFIVSYLIFSRANTANYNANVAVIFLAVIIFVGILSTSAQFMWFKVKYNATLAELKLSKSPIIFMVDSTHYASASQEDTSATLSGYLVMSSDDKLRVNFDSISDYEFLSPTKLLVAGEVSEGYYGERMGLYFIEPTGMTNIKNDVTGIMQHLSLSPSQQYLYYEDGEKMCVAQFTTKNLGSCMNIKDQLPTTWDNVRYFYDKEWLKSADQLIVTVRDNKEHYEIPAKDPSTQPPQRIQKEVARFSINTFNVTISEVALSESTALKTADIFLPEAEKKLVNVLRGDEYDLIFDDKGKTVGIKEIATGKKAKITDVPYIKEMPAFEVIDY